MCCIKHCRLFQDLLPMLEGMPKDKIVKILRTGLLIESGTKPFD